MATLHYIDNEVPAFGEWDAVVTAGSSTIVQSTDAAWPERGAVGLRNTVISAAKAYVRLDALASEESSLAVGFWFKLIETPTWSSGNVCYLAYLRKDAGDSNVLALSNQAGAIKLRVTARTAAGATHAYSNLTIEVGKWYYLVFDNEWTGAYSKAILYINGAEDVTAQKNASGTSRIPNNFRFGGSYASAGVSAQFDLDELKIATTAVGTGYPEPFVPTPETEYPEAARTVVLFRQASSDSREFADYCVSELEIPRANLCPLPNATANESLADYATFQTEVETDLAAWLGRNPTVAANCSCFLISHGVPGCFTSGGVKHSAVSRLMNYGTAFSSQTTNPLYNPATVARLTKTGLGGKYLCSRIDADTLQHVKDIIDRGLAVAGTATLPATDKLYSDDATYRASLACRHLRIITAALDSMPGNDAFIWGDTNIVMFKTVGSRAVFVDDSADSADTFRATSELFDAIVTNGYAAGMGNSETADTFDAESFFEMLRIGGSLAEAFAVAVSKLDYTAVGVGSPLMTVAFQLGGYNIYRGLGGIEGIDWDNPVAYLRAGQDSITFDQDLPPGRRYIYAVRAVSSAGVEERNTHVITYIEPDEQGDLLPAPLARPRDLTVDVQQSSLLIGFSCYAPVGFSDADGFDVLGDNGTGQLDLENPVATIERSRNDRFDFEVSIDRPDTPVLLTVRPRQGQCTGPMSEILFVPLISAPAPTKTL